MTRWRWRGSVALLAVAVGFVTYPVIESQNDVINSDWPAFATGARLIVENPSHLYDIDVQRRVQFEVTGGRTLITLGIKGILPFLAPAWVALITVPFEVFGTNVGGRLWILFELACLASGLYLAVRPRPPTQWLPAFASVPTALMLLNAQLDGLVALGIGAAISLWSKPYCAGLALGLTLVKPQLVVPLGLALVLARHWRVVAGYIAAAAVLWASTAALNPRWVLDWVGPAGTTVQVGSSSTVAAVAGLRGTKSWQQSWSGSVLTSKVPMARAWEVISSLSMPTSGRRMGPAAAASMAPMFSSVCEATWPITSPVTSARASAFRASRSAIRSISRR